MSPERISRKRAEFIARSHACEHCGEYSYKRIAVKPSSPAHEKEFGEVWHAVLVCGVCGMEQEMGIDADGDIVYVA